MYCYNSMVVLFKDKKKVLEFGPEIKTKRASYALLINVGQNKGLQL